MIHFKPQHLLWISLSILLLLACTDPKNKTANSPSQQTDSTKNAFRATAIPLTLGTPEAKADFIMVHYWDRFDFSDTTLVLSSEYSEQAFADFVTLLNNVPSSIAKKGVDELMSRSANVKPIYNLFTELAEKYLYDPNASTRNETIFELFLESRLKNTNLEEVYKLRARNLLKLIKRNKTGSTATDFTYTLKDGSKSRLSMLSANLLLLYFHNPDCHDCKTTREKMLASQLFKKLTKEGTLKVLALYPDEDLTAFKANEKEMPSEWIYAYDKGCFIKNNDLYDLKAIPTLYLLDKDKTVLLKDIPFEVLESYLAKYMGLH